MTKLAIPDYVKSLIDESSLPDSSSLITSSEAIPRISLKGRKFRFKAGGEEIKAVSDSIAVIIVGVLPEHGVARTFYINKYNPGDSDPPDCSSLDGVRPDSWCENRQADTCAECPHSKWGSAESMSGGKAKACKESKILYVIDPTDEDRTVYALQVTVASLKALTTYGKTLAENGLTFSVCITQIIMDDEADYPKINFEYAGVIKKDAIKEFIALAEEKPWATQNNSNLLGHDGTAVDTGNKNKLTSGAAAAPENAATQEKVSVSDADDVLNSWGDE